MIRRINKKTIIYKCIACNCVLVAGRVEANAVTVVADIVAGYGVIVAVIGETDAFIFVIADIVVCYDVVAGMVKDYAVTAAAADNVVAADIVASNGVVVRTVDIDAHQAVVANIVSSSN